MQQMSMSLDQVFSVSELNSEVKWLLDQTFGSIWVEGELSNAMRARTGHFYFSLKDSRSQLRCAMFRNDNRRLDFAPKDGQKVLCRGRLGLYEARGDYQLIVDRMMETGAGDLQRQFEQTKKKLSEQGLFDQQHKKQLPVYPASIGIVTSPTGAAVHDAIKVLQRRYRRAKVIVYPATVQGKEAAPSIVRMLKTANRRAECEVILLIRGGGSLEDLWAFNEEKVAQAVFASTIPIISGVGHEIDYTITDLVADLRAPTPSAAAELCSPDQAALELLISQYNHRLNHAISQRSGTFHTSCQRLFRRLAVQHPSRILQQRLQRCDELELRLNRALTSGINNSKKGSLSLQRRLQLLSPTRQLQRRQQSLTAQSNRLKAIVQSIIDQHRLRLEGSRRTLLAISPLQTLERGYAIAQDRTGQIIRDPAKLAPGQPVLVRVAKGEFAAEVSKKIRNNGRLTKSTKIPPDDQKLT